MKRIAHIIYLAYVILGPPIGFGLGHIVGYRKAERSIKAKAESAKLNIKLHEEKIDSIRNEPDTDAIKRFEQNFGTKHKH